MAVLVGVGGAAVLLKSFLRNTIEGERGNGGVTTWSGDAPGATGAGPTGEVVLFDPDQAFTHTSSAFCVRLGLKLGNEGAEHIEGASAEGELLPVAGDYSPRNCERRK
jgi:hypothetical protein